jgi:hypothetical protein
VLGNLAKVGWQEEIGGKAHGNFLLLRSLCVTNNSNQALFVAKIVNTHYFSMRVP